MKTTFLLEIFIDTKILFGVVSPWQIAIIALAILLLFGGRKIPELMRGFGSGIKEFKKGLKEEDNDEKDEKKK
ncbi:MAG: twin-arginine translocase TatA/TatE family subunit [Flavobacteriales bacterium TMED113]|nr:MAG: twin-arginine translocase TatA/TatE family subunit [Flavobacteriales bacterium TMED113]|tara:strand:- start:3 stop:221 length:219 start_codon:yes stop_codon:yes gene_type:complete